MTGVEHDPHYFLFGASGGGVWETDDAGHTWQNISDGFLGSGSIGAIAIAPTDSNLIYVGTGEGAARGQASVDGDGMYKSVDGGRSWLHIGLSDAGRISRIRIHPQDPNRIYVAVQGRLWSPSSERGVYRSLDGGSTWQAVLQVNESTGAADLSMDPSNPRILYASMWDHQRTPWIMRSGGPGSGLYKSRDGGQTWSKLQKGLPSGTLGKMGVVVSPADPNRVYAILEAEAGGLYRSDDGGEEWRRLSQQRLLFSRPWYFMRVYADPLDVDTLYVLNMQMTKSIDGGRTFTVVPTPHGDNHDLWIHPVHPDWMINSNDGGANVSFNGGRSWSTQENQPTGQFYRVTTDNRIPYHVYGSQQDNSSALALPSRTRGRAISAADVYPVGGGESGFVAFDRDDPRFIYAGANMNFISEYDHRTKQVRNIMAYPEQGLGRDARDLRYRFNWNAPILVSHHDPSVIYHAANVLLKSVDRGHSWLEVSPDLTRNEVEKHGSGGGPITGEAAGGEYYNTILYLAESPHQEGVLWAGTDDGMLQLSEDGGQTWKNRTPPGVGEFQINSVEVSPHQPDVLYVAVTGFRRGDRTALIFKSENRGRGWVRITTGLAEGDPIRVVREDPERPRLLFAGSETGVYVSFDGGGLWQDFRLNLPTTPITDLVVNQGDLVVSTDGRGFWIFDDLEPLRQFSDAMSRSRFQLLAPRETYRMRGSSDHRPSGGNPPNGVFIHYYLGSPTGEELRLEILDANGALVRNFTSQELSRVEAPGATAPPRLPVKTGVNRFVWDMRKAPILRVPGVFLAGIYFGTVEGYKMPPGSYQARLWLGQESQTQSFQILKDPVLETTDSEFQEQAAFLEEVRQLIETVHMSVIRMRAVRDQLNRSKEVTGNVAAGDQIRLRTQDLVEKITAWEEQLIQPRHEAVMDVVNFPTMLNEQILFVKGAVASADSVPTQGAQIRLEELKEEWLGHQQEMERILSEGVTSFNQLFRRNNIPAIVVPD